MTKPDKLTYKNITQPAPGGYQVRVVCTGKEISRYFAFRKYGSERKALAAANRYRDTVKKSHTYTYKVKRRLIPLKNNTSTGVVGVSRTISHDRRKDLSYLVFSVCWVDVNNTRKIKGFRVGNVETYDAATEALALAAAKAFRRDWEQHCDNNTLCLFDPRVYLKWRHMKFS